MGSLHKKSTHQKSKDWITPAILNSCKTKNRLYKKFLCNRSTINLNEYKRFRNRLTSVIRQAKKSYFSNLFSNSTQDTKSMWRSINNLLYGRGNNYTPDKINHHGTSVSNPLNVSNIFNDYFIDVGPATQAKIPPSRSSYKSYLPNRVVDSLFINPTTHEEVLNIIFSLKNSAPGFDGIPIIVVKHVAYSLCTPLTHLFNLSLEKGIVPSSLKIARVVPVYKSGDKDSVKNYRPISILPCLSKVLEKLMFTRLYSFLVKHNLLYDYQFGFLPGRSTSQAILHFVNQVTEAFEKNQYVSGIFLDLSKAFDTLDHNILLNKLEHYGVRGIPLDWFKSYMNNRYQFVGINNVNSSRKSITCGVP